MTMNRRRLLLDDDGRLPSALCIGNLLDQQNYDYSVLTSKSSNQSVVLKPDAQQPNPCRLLDYTTKHVVNCIDAYNSIKQTVIWTNKPLNDNPSIITNDTSNETKEPTAVSMLRVAFVGDSRIRQQFFNFLKVMIAGKQQNSSFYQLHRPKCRFLTIIDFLKIISQLILTDSYDYQAPICVFVSSLMKKMTVNSRLR